MKTATYFEEVFKTSEDFISSMIAKMLSQQSVVSFNEIDEEYVTLWNASMAFYNSMKKTCLEWARDQDKNISTLDEKLDRIAIQNKELAYELSKLQIESAKR